MLRYRADRRTLAFIVIYFALTAYLFVAAPASWWVTGPLLVVACFFSFFGAVATHNTTCMSRFIPRCVNIGQWMV
ncbi:MAG: fatty acid desaturase, partial [Myxococcota bacterium]